MSHGRHTCADVEAALSVACARVEHLTRQANEVPGLTATLDELFWFADLVRECLREHDDANGLLTGVKQPDSPITLRIRLALNALPRPTEKFRALPRLCPGCRALDGEHAVAKMIERGMPEGGEGGT